MSKYQQQPPYRHSSEREHPDFSSRHEVHHCLVTFFPSKQLRDLHMLACAYFPACNISHCFPVQYLPLSPLAAVVDDVLPRLGHCLFAPPIFIVLLLSEPFLVDCSECMPGLK